MSRKVLYAAIAIVALGAGTQIWLQTRPAPAVQDPQVAAGYQTVNLQLGDRTIRLDVADTPDKQRLGLGQRADLPPNRGMLFTYNAPGDRCFWMKDMNFPIDIVWLDANKKIIHIEQNLSPDTYPQTFCPPTPASYVVELYPESVTEYGLKNGDTLAVEL